MVRRGNERVVYEKWYVYYFSTDFPREMTEMMYNILYLRYNFVPCVVK